MNRRIKHYATCIARRILISAPDGNEKEQVRTQLVARLISWREQQLKEWYEELERHWDNRDRDKQHALLYHHFCRTMLMVV